MLDRTLLVAACLAAMLAALPATAACPVPVYGPQGTDEITDWYAKYMLPLAKSPNAARPGKSEIGELISKANALHRRSISDPLYFEPLVQKISAQYANDGDFRGLNTEVAEKLVGANSADGLDFSTLCIDTRRDRFPDDTFAVTLTGVNSDNCQHAVTRGLVFSNTLVNGSATGECRPDHIYRQSFFSAVSAGTNTITFVCNKTAGGCMRH